MRLVYSIGINADRRAMAWWRDWFYYPWLHWVAVTVLLILYAGGYLIDSYDTTIRMCRPVSWWKLWYDYSYVQAGILALIMVAPTSSPVGGDMRRQDRPWFPGTVPFRLITPSVRCNVHDYSLSCPGHWTELVLWIRGLYEGRADSLITRYYSRNQLMDNSVFQLSVT